MRMFNAYIGSIFLYNSELWTTNLHVNDKIDIIHRKFLRRILNIKWPKKITNANLYEITKQKPWSEVVRKRAVSWLGHLLRLDPKTPAMRALREFIKESKRPKGRPKDTWLAMIKKCLKQNGLRIGFFSYESMIKDLEIICADRQNWKTIVKNIKLM